ncbi:VOC family protein [Flavobacterium aquidurense]|uniref:VOC family protein n=1 Tax=Flavobacterium aquidurense TaxID=362413 RepID=UPI00285862F7|nr:VOC family protein [Flavobacterium aquidurense]MDR7369982.1 putative enzyme related to lactoylglutathione lyase [Flavobacterium aquidurense]
MHIRLLVLRTGNPERLADFYGLFGLTFEYHKHGNSPMHYNAAMGQTILEIYPLAQEQAYPDVNLRLGFELTSFKETVQKLKDNNVHFFSEPAITDFGFMTIIADPDGRKIELYDQQTAF